MKRCGWRFGHGATMCVVGKAMGAVLTAEEGPCANFHEPLQDRAA